MALIHAFLVVTLRANQIVSGLALTIFAGAAGLSSYLGNDLEPRQRSRREHPFTPFLPHALRDGADRRADPVRPERARLRLVGRASRSSRCYLARTRPGPERARGRRVARRPPTRWGSTSPRYRYAHTLVGGAFAGVGGATFSLAITPQWVDGLTGGAGWIAIALVIFAFWRPALCLVGAYLFGAFSGAAVHVPGARAS